MLGMKVVQAGFRILGAMADRRQYQLPVETESGMKVVNLTMQTGGVEARGITIRMEAGAYGMLQAQIRMDEAGTCTGEILGGSSEAYTWLAGRTDAFRELDAGSVYADAAVGPRAGQPAPLRTGLELPAQRRGQRAGKRTHTNCGGRQYSSLRLWRNLPIYNIVKPGCGRIVCRGYDA